MNEKKFVPSKYQQAVYDFITNGNGNAVVDAVAGSGKSTTIVEALKLIPSNKSVLFLAFNKAIVEELIVKIGNQDNATIKTLHSLGASAVMSTFKSQLNNNKYRVYINDAFKFGSIKPNIKLYEEEILDYKATIVKLVDLARNTLSTSVQQLEDIAEKYQIFIQDNECQMALNVIEWGKNETKEIDFTDMIFFPNVKNIRMPKFDFVFIDECQDLNTAQREMFLKCIADNGRFVSVGDPRQAIYGFSGADVESFNILKGLPNTTLLPLSVCYRCDGDIISLAKTIVPQIEARENAPLGIVNRDARLKDIADGDMVLCRVTSPLVSLCMKYLADGVKAYVKGKDVGANLINMIKKTNRRNIEDVIERLESELDKIATKIMRKQHCDLTDAREDATYKAHKDKVRAIEVLSGNLKTADAVIHRIETIFKDEDRNGICLSTIHKAKGLESNNVFIICEEKMLLKRAMKIEWMKEQEYNLVYVAYTRAKKMLGFVTDFSCDE
jgi:DNA helicase II / ATP-dependent DNA helicase PcrA